MYSMTGYAVKTFDFKDFALTIEIKSLNNKFQELRYRLPPSLEHLEERMRKVLRKCVHRGKIEVSVTLSLKDEREVQNLASLVSRYHHIIEKVKKETRVRLKASLAEMSALINLLGPGEELTSARVPEEPVMEAFQETLNTFQESRLVEGASARKDILIYLDFIAGSLNRIESLSPPVVERYKNQMRDKIRELLDEKLDETRIMMEVGIFASKVDISEEISRIYGHLQKFSSTIDGVEPCGRELDFILQELLREINTVGAKVPDYSISEEVVKVKSNLEKIKEQVRNIE